MTIVTENFQSNLALFTERNALLALRLQVEEKRVLPSPCHSFSEAIKEKEAADILYLYNWEGSTEYTLFLHYLHAKSKRRLVLLLQGLPILAALLESSSITPLLKEKRITWVLLEEETMPGLKPIIWETLSHSSSFCSLASPNSLIAKKGQKWQKQIVDLELEAKLLLSSKRDFDCKSFQNLCLNLGRMKEVKQASHLFGVFPRTAAIVCGAGPSLARQVDLLKELDGRAILIAAGSALSCLERAGILPHFTAALDPDIPPERMRRQNGFLVPFFYQHQLSPMLFTLLSGEKWAISGSEYCLLEKELLTRLQIDSFSFEVGWNAATFATHIAYRLGCCPIILIGVDGCVQKKQVYAEGGFEPDEGEKWTRIDDIPCLDQYGKETRSRADFLLGRKWLDTFALQHPDCMLVNATEGGLPFTHIPTHSLREVRDAYLGPPQDLSAKIHQAMANATSQPVNKEKVFVEIDRIKKSILQSKTFCLNILQGYQGGGIEKQKGTLAEIELEEELFFQKVLLPVWEIWRYVLQTESVVKEMKDPLIEKKLQKVLFWRRVCEEYIKVLERLEQER